MDGDGVPETEHSRRPEKTRGLPSSFEYPRQLAAARNSKWGCFLPAAVIMHPRRWAPLALRFLLSTRGEAQYCATTNAYDEPDAGGPGACADLIGGGSWTCAGDFAIGQDHQGYCNSECQINVYDSATSNSGACDSFIASGMTCCQDFAPGRDGYGYCDFACSLCPNQVPAPAPGSCRTQNVYDDYGALQCPGQCQTLIMSGVATCADSFAEGGDLAGLCNLACGFNMADTSAGNVGLCDGLLDSGDTCAEHFGAGQPNDGYCDLTCGFCVAALDKTALLNFRVGQQVGLTTGSLPWTNFAADPLDQLLSWSQGSMPCLIGWDSALQGWVGTTCDQVNGRVVQISLSNLGVTGDIMYLDELTALQSLDLHGSAGIAGDIESLASLTGLITLDLDRCAQILGSISVLGTFTQLTTLKLPDTGVGGDIQSLATLTSLAHLDLSSSAVFGQITSLNGLSALTFLDITASQVVGSVAGVRGILGMAEWSSFSPCSLYSCGTGFQLKPTPSSLAGTSTLACCDALATCGEIECGIGYVQDSTATALFCTDVTCDASRSVDFNLCCESRQCASPEGSAEASGYVVDNNLATTVESLGSITCAETHVLVEGSTASARCNTGMVFEFSGCELPPPVVEANETVVIVNVTVVTVTVIRDNSSDVIIQNAAQSVVPDISSRMTAFVVVGLLLTACLIVIHLFMRRSAKIQIMNTYDDAEDDLERLLYSRVTESQPSTELDALVGSAEVLLLLSKATGDTDALIEALRTEIMKVMEKKHTTRRAIQDKLVGHKTAKLTELRAALLAADVDAVVVDELISELQAADNSEARAALELEVALDAEYASLLAKRKIEFDLATMNTRDTKSKLTLRDVYEADRNQAQSHFEVQRSSQRQDLYAKLYANKMDLYGRQTSKLAGLATDATAMTLLQNAHNTEANAEQSLVLAASGEAHAIEYRVELDVVMAKRQASRAVAQQRLLQRRDKIAGRQKKELASVGLGVQIITQIQEERQQADKEEAQAVLMLEAEADAEEAATLTKHRAELHAAIDTASGDTQTQVNLNQQYEEETNLLREQMNAKRASKREQLRERLSVKKHTMLEKEKLLLRRDDGTNDIDVVATVIDTQYEARDSGMQALVDLMKSKKELEAQAAQHEKQMEDLKAAHKRERAEQQEMMAEVTRKFQEEVQRKKSSESTLAAENDSDADPTSTKFRRRVRRMSIELMDEHADERALEQQKLDATAAEKRRRLAARLALKKKSLTESSKQQCDAEPDDEERTHTDENSQFEHLTTAPAANGEDCANHDDAHRDHNEVAAFIAAETEGDDIPPAPPPALQIGKRATGRRRSFGNQEVDDFLSEELSTTLAQPFPPPPMHSPVFSRRRREDDGTNSTDRLLFAVPTAPQQTQE